MIARSLTRYRSPDTAAFCCKTRNKAAVLTFKKPRHQPGREHVRRAYDTIRKLKTEGNRTTITGLPSHEGHKLMELAKKKEKATTCLSASPQTQLPTVQSTTLNMARSQKMPLEAYLTMLEDTPREPIRHYQASKRDNCTMDLHGKRPACWPSSGRA